MYFDKGNTEIRNLSLYLQTRISCQHTEREALWISCLDIFDLFSNIGKSIVTEEVNRFD